MEMALPATLEFTSPRAWAFSLLGIQEYLDHFPGDRNVQKTSDVLAQRLLHAYLANRSDSWCWFEDVLAYDNARLAQALLRCGVRNADTTMTAAALEALDWLVREQSSEDQAHFVPIGSQGFYRKGGTKARFDQQPVEASATVAACLEAFRETGDERWRKEAWLAFNWFLGDNDLQIVLYDSATGGCMDGLHPDSGNENQGAESTLAFLMASLELRLLEESEISLIKHDPRQAAMDFSANREPAINAITKNQPQEAS
jgi:hypothetical protein